MIRDELTGESCELEDIPEMRPEAVPDGWYDVVDLRDNPSRNYLGLSDWQADFPLIPETDEDTDRAIDRLLSYFM